MPATPSLTTVTVTRPRPLRVGFLALTDAAPLVTTNEPTDSTKLDAKRTKELPINGRDLNTLNRD